jgi:hypothetical protein
MEKLEIENFKGIGNLDLDVRPFTVLIGPQSVGKSVTAKLLFYFKTIVFETLNAAIRNSENSLRSQLVNRFNYLLPEPTHKMGPSSARYHIGSAHFSLTHKGSEDAQWQIELPQFLEEEYEKIKDGFMSIKAKRSVDEEQQTEQLGLFRIQTTENYFEKVKQTLGPQSVQLSRFIPSGRAFYAQIERDFVSFFDSANVDPFVKYFGIYLAGLKDAPNREVPSGRKMKHAEATALAAELANSLLSGKYYREGQKDFISVLDGRNIPVSLWSSGQQESFPLVFLLQKFCEGFLRRRRGTCLFVEEPEAHLFPSSQRKMIELVSLAFNSTDQGLNIFITTHSPYVLSTLNVLLKAGQIYTSKQTVSKLSDVSKVVPQLEGLAPNCLGAYYMDREGCRSIIDEETRLINGRAIDDVSGELADQLDALNDLQ